MTCCRHVLELELRSKRGQVGAGLRIGSALARPMQDQPVCREGGGRGGLLRPPRPRTPSA